MSRQYFRELLEPIPVADLAAVTGGTVEVSLFPAATWAATAANSLRPGQMLKLSIFGLCTTPATPGNLTITPRYGTTTGGITMGASVAAAMTASLTNVPFFLEFLVTCRAVGATGSMVGGGLLTSQILAAPLTFGGTTATIDTTIAGGLFIGETPGTTGTSFTPKGIAFESLN